MNASQNKTFEDRRKYPRLILQIPLKVHIGNGLYALACLHDISPDGMQIRCNKQTEGQIHAIAKIREGREKPSIMVEFKLPNDPTNEAIVVKCRICYFGPLTAGAKDDVAFGLQFAQFSGTSLKKIKHFFLSEMEPA